MTSLHDASSQPISVVVRLKGPSPPGPSYSATATSLTICTKKAGAPGAPQNAPEAHALSGLLAVLPPSATQEEVYGAAARDIVEGVVRDGISGCLLAYGQTGAGKTHTMVGGDAFAARGVMPRALSHLFLLVDAAAARAAPDEVPPSLRMSFLEVLNDRVVDLLAGAAPAPGTAADRAAALGAGGPTAPALVVQEDRAGRPYVPGLLAPRVGSEAEALRLLLEGCAARALAEHALNRASTRSHAVLTVHVDVAGGGCARLHLVDLAGSERVKKSESEGARLREACGINKSLSALEQVVLALSASGGAEGGGAQDHHVPYRSSKLTHILKDALGGGPGRTRLLAALWAEEAHLDESVATLRFAGRVMNVRTRVAKGGGGDGGGGGAGSAALEAEVRLLKRELALHDALAGAGARGAGAGARPGARHEPLTLGEAAAVKALVARYLEGGEEEAVGSKLTTVRHIEAAMAELREAVWAARGGGGGGGGGGGAPAAAEETSAAPAPPPPPRQQHPPHPAPAAGDPQAAALHAWRATSPEFARFEEARRTLREARGRYAAASAAVADAKRGVEAAMAALGAGSGAAGDALAEALADARRAYRARCEDAAGLKREVEFATAAADALARQVAALFQEHQATEVIPGGV
jgi:kinesin family protein 6/9